jgi:protein-S-isoprenylcysteine O-methyltransferase Ste14
MASLPVRLFIKFLIGATLFIGLPLLGWGIFDIAGFFSQPTRLIYVFMVVVLNAFAVIGFPHMGQRGGETKTKVQRQKWAILMLQILSLSIVFVGPFCDRRGIAVIADCSLVRYIGLSAYFIGFIIMVWAEAYLGRQFSLEVSIQEGHRLITDGIYSHLRHPRYLGITIFSAGLALLFRSWISVILAVVTLMVLLWRIGDEEAMMHEEFGADWECYVNRSKKLIPFVY